MLDDQKRYCMGHGVFFFEKDWEVVVRISGLRYLRVVGRKTTLEKQFTDF